MPRLVGFSRFAALPEEQISEKISRRILSGDQGMIVWWRSGLASMSSRTVTRMSRSCGCLRARWSSASATSSGSAVRATWWSFREVEHEAWVREDTEVIDFFAPPRDDFLVGGKPAYMSEG